MEPPPHNYTEYDNSQCAETLPFPTFSSVGEAQANCDYDISCLAVGRTNGVIRWCLGTGSMSGSGTDAVYLKQALQIGCTVRPDLICTHFDMTGNGRVDSYDVDYVLDNGGRG